MRPGDHQIRLKFPNLTPQPPSCTDTGLLNIRVMPFGTVRCTTQPISRIMNHLLSDGLDKFVLVFLDGHFDTATPTKDPHLQRGAVNFGQTSVGEVCDGRLPKCDFFSIGQLSTLALTLGRTGSNRNCQKSRLILDWPTPETVTIT